MNLIHFCDTAENEQLKKLSHFKGGQRGMERCTAFSEVRLRSFTICKQVCIVLACTNFATTEYLYSQNYSKRVNGSLLTFPTSAA